MDQTQLYCSDFLWRNKLHFRRYKRQVWIGYKFPSLFWGDPYVAHLLIPSIDLHFLCKLAKSFCGSRFNRCESHINFVLRYFMFLFRRSCQSQQRDNRLPFYFRNHLYSCSLQVYIRGNYFYQAGFVYFSHSCGDGLCHIEQENGL